MASCGLARALVGTSPSTWEVPNEVLTWNLWEAFIGHFFPRTPVWAWRFRWKLCELCLKD